MSAENCFYEDVLKQFKDYIKGKIFPNFYQDEDCDVLEYSPGPCEIIRIRLYDGPIINIVVDHDSMNRYTKNVKYKKLFSGELRYTSEDISFVFKCLDHYEYFVQ